MGSILQRPGPIPATRPPCPPAAGPLRPGDQVGPYRLVGYHAYGGFADVWRAEDIATGRRTVALKVLRGLDSEEDRQSFYAEVRTLRQLSHPHIVRILADPIPHPTLDGTLLALAEPWYDRHLGQLAVRTLSDNERLAILSAIASALAVIHARGLVHADLKPANILLDESGRPVLADFGLASHVARLSSDDLRGTRSWMAPEILLADPSIRRLAGQLGLVLPAVHDARLADLYALGLLIWWLWFGELPWRIERAEDLVERFRPRLEVASDPLPLEVRRLVLELLSADPSARPHNAADILDRLTLAPTAARTAIDAALELPPAIDLEEGVALAAAELEADPAGVIVIRGPHGAGVCRAAAEVKAELEARDPRLASRVMLTTDAVPSTGPAIVALHRDPPLRPDPQAFDLDPASAEAMTALLRGIFGDVADLEASSETLLRGSGGLMGTAVRLLRALAALPADPGRRLPPGIELGPSLEWKIAWERLPEAVRILEAPLARYQALFKVLPAADQDLLLRAALADRPVAGRLSRETPLVRQDGRTVLVSDALAREVLLARLDPADPRFAEVAALLEGDDPEAACDLYRRGGDPRARALACQLLERHHAAGEHHRAVHYGELLEQELGWPEQPLARARRLLLFAEALDARVGAPPLECLTAARRAREILAGRLAGRPVRESALEARAIALLAGSPEEFEAARDLARRGGDPEAQVRAALLGAAAAARRGDHGATLASVHGLLTLTPWLDLPPALAERFILLARSFDTRQCFTEEQRTSLWAVADRTISTPCEAAGRMLYAERHTLAGDLPSCLAEYGRAVALAPAGPVWVRAAYYYASVAHILGRAALGRRWRDAIALVAPPAATRLDITRVDALLLAGAYAGALALATDLMSRGDRPYVQPMYEEILSDLGEDRAAEITALRQVAIPFFHPLLDVLLARVHARQGRPDAALALAMDAAQRACALDAPLGELEPTVGLYAAGVCLALGAVDVATPLIERFRQAPGQWAPLAHHLAGLAFNDRTAFERAAREAPRLGRRPLEIAARVHLGWPVDTLLAQICQGLSDPHRGFVVWRLTQAKGWA